MLHAPFLIPTPIQVEYLSIHMQKNEFGPTQPHTKMNSQSTNDLIQELKLLNS